MLHVRQLSHGCTHTNTLMKPFRFLFSLAFSLHSCNLPDASELIVCFSGFMSVPCKNRCHIPHEIKDTDISNIIHPIYTLTMYNFAPMGIFLGVWCCINILVSIKTHVKQERRHNISPGNILHRLHAHCANHLQQLISYKTCTFPYFQSHSYVQKFK